MSAKIGSFNVKAEIGQAVEKVQTSLKGALHARKQKKFERGVSFKSAKVKAKVAKAPRKGMSSAEITNMDEARTSLHLVARDSFDEERWARDAWTEMDRRPPPTKQALKDALAGLKSDELRKIRVRATRLNAMTHKVLQLDETCWHEPDDDTSSKRKHVLKLIVEACNDGLLVKNHPSEFLESKMQTEEAKSVGREAAEVAYGDWLLKPGRNLATALHEGRPSAEIQTLIEGLAPGHKAFGDGSTNRVLFDEFITTPPLRSKDIDEIGRRGFALLELTQGNKAYRELNRTGWLMLKVHNAYYKSKKYEIVTDPETGENTAYPNKSIAIQAPKHALVDEIWARMKIVGDDLEAASMTIAGDSLEARTDAVVQALRAGSNMETLLGPLEALASKVAWNDVAPVWDRLVAAFQVDGDLDFSRLGEFGATLHEVATANPGAPGYDHALKVARAAMMVANAGVVAQGDEVPDPSPNALWNEHCLTVLHGEVAHPAPLVDPEVDDPTIISGPYWAVPLSQLRSGADQDATNDDRPDLLSLSPTQEEDRGHVRRFQHARQAMKGPTEDERLSQELSDVMGQLIAAEAVAVEEIAAPSVVSPSEAVKRLFDSIETGNVKGYVASLRTLEELGGEQGSEAVDDAIVEVFNGRSKPSRLTMANNIGAIHDAVEDMAVDEDILDASEKFSNWLRDTREDEVSVESIASIEVTPQSAAAEELFDSIEKGSVERYIASLKTLDKLNEDDLDPGNALTEALDRRSESSLKNIFNNSARLHESVAKRRDVGKSIRELSEQMTLLISPSLVVKKLFDSIAIFDVEGYVESLETIADLATRRRVSVNEALKSIFVHRSNASKQIISDTIGEMHAALQSRDNVEKKILNLSKSFSEQSRAAGKGPATQTNARPKSRALARRKFGERLAQKAGGPGAVRDNGLAPVRRRPRALQAVKNGAPKPDRTAEIEADLAKLVNPT